MIYSHLFAFFMTRLRLRKCSLCYVKFLYFGTPQIFAVIYLKFKQRGYKQSILSKWCQWKNKQWRPWSSRSSLILVCTVCPALSVRKFRVIIRYSLIIIPQAYKVYRGYIVFAFSVTMLVCKLFFPMFKDFSGTTWLRIMKFGTKL